MEKKEIRGVMALMTKYHPCDENGAIDEESFIRHLNWLVDKGVHAVGVNCGADFDYNDKERKRITELLVKEVNGRIPCYMGASAWDTETAVKRAKDVEQSGADGVFVTGPPLDRPIPGDPVAGIVGHFKRISDAVSIPISFYNTPGAWPGIMPPETLKKIEEAAPNVTYVKAGPRELSEYKVMADGLADSRLKIIAGKSYCNFHQLQYSWDKPNRPVGLCGYLPALIPAESVALWNAFEENDFDKAREIWYAKILPISDLFYGRAFGYNEKFHPIEFLHQIGIIKTNRIPFSIARVDEYTRNEMAKYVEQVKPQI